MTTNSSTSPQPDMFRTILSALIGVPFGVVYGLVARLSYDATSGLGDLFATMTLGFLCLVPFAVGALTVAVAPPPMRRNFVYAAGMPLLSTLLWVLAAGALAWEAAICIVMASPLLAVMASVGGLIVAAVARSRGGEQALAVALLALAAPFLVTPLEMQRPAEDSLRHVANYIDVAASPEEVWPHIASVPEIREWEQGRSVFHLLGLPRPLAAEISHHGVGGIRDATFEGGLTFVETVDRWEYPERLGFTIDIDRSIIQPAPLNQIGGEYLDVLYGEYRLELLPNGHTRLHLTSDHRLSTRFNWYGSFWSEWIMHDLQQYILRIIKARVEAT